IDTDATAPAYQYWPTYLTAAMTVPAVGATTTVSLTPDTPPYAVGQWVYVEGTGFFEVTAVDLLANTATLLNNGSQGNQPAGYVAAVNTLVTSASPPGADGISVLTAAFTMPNVGATAVAAVDDGVPPFTVGQWTYINPIGWLVVTAVAPNAITLRNDD